MFSATTPSFDFRADLARSQAFVDDLARRISAAGLVCTPPEHFKDADICVYAPDGQLVARVEAKMLSRLFLKAFEYTGLTPEDCLTVDASKFRHYLAQSEADMRVHGRAIPTFICFSTPAAQVFQEVNSLARATPDGVARSYTRREGEGDGAKGCRAKLYFSAQDCQPLDGLVAAILEAAAAISKPPTSRQFSYARHLAQRLGYPPEGLAQVCRQAMTAWLTQAERALKPGSVGPLALG